jgi:hypothetical protein
VCAELFSWLILIWSLRPKVVVMLVVTLVPVILAVAALFPVVTVGLVFGVMVALLPGVVDT